MRMKLSVEFSGSSALSGSRMKAGMARFRGSRLVVDAGIVVAVNGGGGNVSWSGTAADMH